ncbi:solute carrier family 25 member 44 [Tanacetum coccineum]
MPRFSTNQCAGDCQRVKQCVRWCQGIASRRIFRACTIGRGIYPALVDDFDDSETKPVERSSVDNYTQAVATKESVEKSAYDVIRGLVKVEGVPEPIKVAAFKMVEPFKLSDPIKAAIANGHAGMTASLFSQGVFVPIDVVCLICHARYNGGLDVARKVLKQNGVRGLYRGFGQSVITYSPSSAVWWASYGSGQHVIWNLLGHGTDSTGALPGQGTVVLVQGAGGILLEDMKVAHLTHVSEMEKKIETLARITTILKEYMYGRMAIRTDNQEKNEKQSQNNKTGLGMEKTVKDKAKSKPESQSSQKVNRKVNWSKSKSTQVNPGAKVQEK